MPAETLAIKEALNRALRLALDDDPGVFLLGEDIGVYGGAFGVTDGLVHDYGEHRVIDTPISEDAMVGAAVGAALQGMRPVAEMQFSDFVVNAMDALVNQAAKLHYMYGGSTTVPLVVRLPGGGGTGAAQQHSQSFEAWFAHVPGLKVIAPGTAQDFHDLLLAAIADPTPVVFCEHKALYKEEGPVESRAHLADSPATIGEAAIRRHGADLTIATYSLMLTRSLEAADSLAERGIEAEVVDLRTLRPLDRDAVRDSVKRTGRLLVVHEAPRSVGVGAEVVSAVTESAALDHLLAPVRRVCGLEVPIPYAAHLERSVIPQVEDVEKAAVELVEA